MHRHLLAVSLLLASLAAACVESDDPAILAEDAVELEPADVPITSGAGTGHEDDVPADVINEPAGPDYGTGHEDDAPADVINEPAGPDCCARTTRRPGAPGLVSATRAW